MKAKKQKAAALVLAAALSMNLQTVCPLAAAPDAQATAPVQENNQESPEAQEPDIPESYEWEIQSNSIPGWPQGPKIICETGIVMDLDTGQILYAKGIDEKRAPASITKIMTALLAIEKVPLDTKITFTDEVNNIEADSTHIGIKPGETLTMEESLYGILLGSANEVSSGVAEYIGGTVQDFVDMMNEKAKELGCENTHFVNANGLYAEDHYTTARDMALIAKAAFQNETFRNIVKTPYYIIPPTNITPEERWINNHHRMLTEGGIHYEGCLGGKTGYTEKAGNTLVTYAERNSMRLVCVVLKGNTEYYNDTKNLLDYGFNNFQKLTLSSDILAGSDSLASYLKEQALLDAAVETSSADVPVNPSQEIACQAEIENHTLNLDFYYGDTLLGSSSQKATSEILAAAQTYDQQQRQKEQISDSAPASAETEMDPENRIDPSSLIDPDSLGGFFREAVLVFQGLPGWKYPALGLLAGAFIFYIILLIIRIRRSIRSRKMKRKNKKA